MSQKEIPLYLHGLQTFNNNNVFVYSFFDCFVFCRSWGGSSVGIVPDFRLNTNVRFPAETKDFSSSLCIAYNSALGLTQPFIQWIPWVLAWG
jgi:hypothetical protein